MKWALIPQFQPTRALLFVVVVALFSAAVAAMRAAARGGWVEAFAWLVIPYLLPVNTKIFAVPGWNRGAVVAGLAALAVAAAWAEARKFRWAPVALAAAMLAGYLAIPLAAHVQNYPRLHTPPRARQEAGLRKRAVGSVPDPLAAEVSACATLEEYARACIRIPAPRRTIEERRHRFRGSGGPRGG
jgi:hypothetical protein